jgi:hypothetical protein
VGTSYILCYVRKTSERMAKWVSSNAVRCSYNIETAETSLSLLKPSGKYLSHLHDNL